MKKLIFGFILLMSILFSGSAFPLYWEFYPVDNLISRELIKGVYRDELGYLWITTDAGLLRYDGDETKRYFEGLNSPYTKSLLKSSNGHLYILHDFGIMQINHKNDSVYFESLPFPHPKKDSVGVVRSFYEDHLGNIWIGEQNTVVRWNRDGFKRFALNKESRLINFHRSFSFTEDIFGHLWIVSFNGNLLYWDQKNDLLKEVEVVKSLTNVSSLISMKGDYLLAGGKEGVLLLKIDSDQQILGSQLIGGVKDVSCLAFVGNAEVFAGTWLSGIYHIYIENDKSPQIQKVEKVPFNDIFSLHFDQLRNELWVTGNENIGVFKPTLVAMVVSDGFRVESITVDEKNDIYYSAGSQIFRQKNWEDGQKELIYKDDQSYFNKILVEQHKVWLGSSTGEISYFDLEKKLKTALVTSPDKNSVQFILKDQKGRKWFTGLSAGLISIDKDLKVKYYTNLKSTSVIVESKIGEIYCVNISKEGFLYKYDQNSDNFELLAKQLPFNGEKQNIEIFDVKIGDENILWIASDLGLLQTSLNSNNSTAQFVSVEGLHLNEPIWAIEVSNERLFIASALGLFLYKKDGKAFCLSTRNSTLSLRFKEREMKFYNPDLLLFATAKGIGALNQNDIIIKQTSTPFFKDITINGTSLNPFEQNETFANRSTIEANYITLSFPNANIEYQYRIKGLSDQWTMPSENRNISLFGLPFGQFEIQIRARENRRLWSEVLSYSFYITKPWYSTLWGILIFVLIIILVIWLSIKIYYYRLVRHRYQLKKIIDERTKEINQQKNQIIVQQIELIEQKNNIILQKEELLDKNDAIHQSKQALADADINFLKLKEKQLNDMIAFKNKQITTHTLNIIQKNEILSNLRSKLDEVVKTSVTEKFKKELKMTIKLIDESFKLDKDWEDFSLYFEQVHTGFFTKLKVNFPDISTQELRHCALIRLNLTNSECASILGISSDSIKVSRNRLRKKLKLEGNANLLDFIMSF